MKFEWQVQYSTSLIKKQIIRGEAIGILCGAAGAGVRRRKGLRAGRSFFRVGGVKIGNNFYERFAKRALLCYNVL